MSIISTLGIPTSGSDVEINKAFKKAIMANHPDRGGDHETIIEILKAWEAFKAGILNTIVAPVITDFQTYESLRTRLEAALARNGGEPSRGSERIRDRMEELFGKSY